MGKKLLTWGVVGFILFFMAFRPEGAARITRWIGGALAHLASGFGDFISRLT
jgi:hypothetical protein